MLGGTHRKLALKLLGRHFLGLQRRWRARRGHPGWRSSHRFTGHHGRVVLHGPFAGLRYPESTVGIADALIPKLLGAFEQELGEVVEEAIAAGYDTIVNIGAAEGYYAVGFALKSPVSTVYAFELDALERRLCRELAEANGVAERVVIESECDVPKLRALDGERPFVFCDCEGCEAEVLRPDVVPLLRRATVVAELHDFAYPGIAGELRERFAETHDARLIDSRERDPSRYEELSVLDPVERDFAVSEHRDGTMQWALFTPRRP